MPKLTVWPEGSSAGSAGPGRKAGAGGKPRGEIMGWSKASARNSMKWLWSVNPDGLGDDGWALTLTMGGLPETAAEWHASRRAFLKRLDRAGVRSFHWVIEFTRKGRPHLHMAVYGPGQVDAIAVVAWLDICKKKGWPANYKSQHIVPISNATGWAQYVSKHGARGVDHYQRSETPEGWEKTGRLWGHGGDWPVTAPLELELEPAEFFRYRRLLLRYVRARLAAAGVQGKYIKKVGVNLRAKESYTMGVGYWVREDISVLLADMSLGAIPHLRDYGWME